MNHGLRVAIVTQHTQYKSCCTVINLKNALESLLFLRENKLELTNVFKKLVFIAVLSAGLIGKLKKFFEFLLAGSNNMTYKPDSHFFFPQYLTGI